MRDNVLTAKYPKWVVQKLLRMLFYQRPPLRILCTFCLAVLPAQPSSHAQGNFADSLEPKKELYHRVSRDEILKADKDGVLDRHFHFVIEDSILVYRWKGHLWFTFKIPGTVWDENWWVELFAYSDSTRTIKQVTHQDISYMKGLIGDFHIYNGHMFLIDYLQEEPTVLRIMVVDPSRLAVSKEVYLKADTWVAFDTMLVDQGKLCIDVQPLGRTLNPSYFLFILRERDRGPKWLYHKVGNRHRYVLDADFDIVANEELN